MGDLLHIADIIYTADNEGHPFYHLAAMAATVALREVLNQGISSGTFVDTKFILYSHRNSSGRVGRPKALYANSHVLKTIPYFNDREYPATFNIACRSSYNHF